MQHRGFIQFALLLLASGCLVFGLLTTLVTLVLFAVAIELVSWSGILESKPEFEAQGNAL